MEGTTQGEIDSFRSSFAQQDVFRRSLSYIFEI